MLNNENYGYLIHPLSQFMDANLKPLTSAYIKVLDAGTGSSAYTYSDWEGTLNPSNIMLSMNGSANVIAEKNKAYKVMLCDALHPPSNPIWVKYNLYVISSTQIAYEGIPEAPDDGLSYARTSKAWNAIGSSIDITDDFELINGMSTNDVGKVGRFRVIYIPSTDMVQIMGNFFSPSSKPYNSWVACMKYTGDLLSFNSVAGSQMNVGLDAPPLYKSVRAIMTSAFILIPNYSDKIFAFKGLIGYDNVPCYGVSAFLTCYGCRAAKLAEIAAAELANSGE